MNKKIIKIGYIMLDFLQEPMYNWYNNIEK